MVGGGLAGLTAADALHRAGRSVTVVEARAAVGGRIRTIVPDGLGEGAWVDLGATWHWSNQPSVRALASDLGLESFPQYRDGQAVVDEGAGAAPRLVDLPPPAPAELRLVGGTQQLCQRLADRMPEGAVLLEREVTVVSAGDSEMTVTVADPGGSESNLPCAAVVVAVPPRLVSAGISFFPSLPPDLIEVMEGTPTWMSTALKVVAIYDSAFWREAGRSGLAFSRAGPLIEVHDGCTPGGEVAALWGFVSPDHAYRDLGPEGRLEPIFDHLGRLFGAEAADPAQYFERDWSDDPYTNDVVVWFDDPLGYGHPALAQPQFDGRLVWAGTETADVGAGHMEGAVRSGQRAAAQVLARLSS